MGLTWYSKLNLPISSSATRLVETIALVTFLSVCIIKQLSVTFFVLCHVCWSRQSLQIVAGKSLLQHDTFTHAVHGGFESKAPKVMQLRCIDYV